MRLVNTKAHALIDYSLGFVLIFSPWLFGFSPRGEAGWVSICLGIYSAVLALITRFEFSLIKLLPLKWHLRMDFVAGVFLATSPWIVGFCPEVFKPHLVFGLMQMVIAVITDRVLYHTFKASVRKEDDIEKNYSPEQKNRKNYF